MAKPATVTTDQDIGLSFQNIENNICQIITKCNTKYFEIDFIAILKAYYPETDKSWDTEFLWCDSIIRVQTLLPIDDSIIPPLLQCELLQKGYKSSVVKEERVYRVTIQVPNEAKD